VVIDLADRRQRAKGTATTQERPRLARVRPNHLRDRRAQSLYCAITLTTRRNPWSSAKRRNIAPYVGEPARQRRTQFASFNFPNSLICSIESSARR
jgi:hypothetical protein